jgi:hypothetical protein
METGCQVGKWPSQRPNANQGLPHTGFPVLGITTYYNDSFWFIVILGFINPWGSTRVIKPPFFLGTFGRGIIILRILYGSWGDLHVFFVWLTSLATLLGTRAGGDDCQESDAAGLGAFFSWASLAVFFFYLGFSMFQHHFYLDRLSKVVGAKMCQTPRRLGYKTIIYSTHKAKPEFSVCFFSVKHLGDFILGCIWCIGGIGRME